MQWHNTVPSVHEAGSMNQYAEELRLCLDELRAASCWRDLEGVEVPDSVGLNAATLTAYRSPIRELLYSVSDMMDIRFHLPHDLVPGSDLYIHFHWSHNATSISGNLTATASSTYAKGHGQEVFPAAKSVLFTYPTVDLATTPAYQHRIEEVAWSVAGGSASLFDSTQIEPDGLILMNFQITGLPTLSGGAAGVFVHRVDMHYLSNNAGTLNKSVPFDA